jgi:bifunctional DNase/RNase
VAVALRAKAPIFVNDKLLQEPPKEGETEADPEESGGAAPRPRALSDEEKAEQLRRYLEDMDPEDFGKFSM